MKRLETGHYPAMIKTLWASVQGNPVFMRRMNGWLTIAWLIMIPNAASIVSFSGR